MTTRCPLDLRRLCNNTVSPCAPLCASLFYLRFHAGGTRAFGVCARYASCLTPCDRNPRGTSSLPLVPKGQDLEDRGWIEVLPHRLTPNLAALGALQSERRLQHPTIWVGLESIGSLSDHTEKSEKHMLGSVEKQKQHSFSIDWAHEDWSWGSFHPSIANHS